MMAAHLDVTARRREAGRCGRVTAAVRGSLARRPQGDRGEPGVPLEGRNPLRPYRSP